MTGWWVRVDNGRPDHPKWSCLSDAAYRFADRLLCWSARHETAFIPHGTALGMVGGNARKLRSVLAEVCEGAALAAGKEHGLFERVEGGLLVHDGEKYWPPGARDRRDGSNPSPAPHQDLRAKRAAAGRLGGLRAATQARRERGRFAPSRADQSPSNGPEPPSNLTEQTPSNITEQTKQVPGLCSAPPQTPPSGTDTETSKKEAVARTWQCFPRARGERPRLHPQLLPVQLLGRDCTPSDDFARYALECGLSASDYQDVLVDWREKCGDRPRTQEWLASMLCRFIEQKAKKLVPPGAADHEENKRLEANARAMERERRREVRQPAPKPLPHGETVKLAEAAMEALGKVRP